MISVNKVKKAFARYKEIIPDWDDFIDSLTLPLPTSFWVNNLRVTPERIIELFKKDGLKLTPVPWYAGAFRLKENFSLGNRLEFLTGLIHIQEEVALTAVKLLDPRPEERILDLCAAPGNKTAQIAVLMQNRGTVIANDYNFDRLRAITRTVHRLGLVNVTITAHNAINYPRNAGQFDKVLVDVPCSCEGTSRKNPEVLDQINLEQSLKLSRLQTLILIRALELCKTGGRVVYSTCTYAPEENEMVVQKALDSLVHKIEAEILPVQIPDFKFCPGIPAWQDLRFRKDMINTMRIYPHQNNTGGFFVAMIRKNGDKKTHLQTNDSQNFLEFVDSSPWISILRERFGFAEEIFEPYKFYKVNARTICLILPDHLTVAKPLRQSAGLPLLRTTLKYPKLTTAGVLMFGQHARKNVLEVNKEQAYCYLRGAAFSVSGNLSLEEGYVILKFENIVLGIALYLNGKIISLFPKAWWIKSHINSGG
ncbi:MAG: hypothetical protein D6813_04960 [Calditrichaeota bacterium]|nr:MAG: hypothetical protein D6813_04960 [Calditrichota bacterium]